MKYLLTYKDAQEISEKYNNNNFWEFQFMKDGYKLAAFNYFICGWNDFANPLPKRPEVNAFDMRGVTFVFNKDGSLWKTFFMLPKFFNLNQVDSTQYGVVKDKEICSITEKEDGSLVAFMMLPNGKLFAKTIGSFTSEQSELAYNLLYTNEEHVLWVKEMLNTGCTPLFEYVSWDNRKGFILNGKIQGNKLLYSQIIYFKTQYPDYEKDKTKDTQLSSLSDKIEEGNKIIFMKDGFKVFRDKSLLDQFKNTKNLRAYLFNFV